MTSSELSDLYEEIFEKVREVRAAAQVEYARHDDRPFANFERIAEATKISRMKVWEVYFRKHIDGIGAHIEGHTLQREDVRGRLLDAINYLLLLWGMVEEDDDAYADDVIGVS